MKENEKKNKKKADKKNAKRRKIKVKNDRHNKMNGNCRKRN